MVWGLLGAQLGGPVELGPVQCDGDCERTADGPLWGQHPELHTWPDSGPGPLPQ